MDRLAAAILLLAGAALAHGTEYTNLPVNTHSELRRIDSCPDAGHFFHRDVVPNAVDPGPCYLCFCRDNHHAVCWIREDNQCDAKKFHHQKLQRNTRVRRSLVGLSDIFLRDATKKFFNNKLPQQCKPRKESFSEGCPPDDWCIGCTVCDCDVNGRWDCHVLSFCDGKHSNKKLAVVSERKGIHNKKKVVNKNKQKPFIKNKYDKKRNKTNVIAKKNNKRRRNNKSTNNGKSQQKRKQKINLPRKKQKPQSKNNKSLKYISKKANNINVQNNLDLTKINVLSVMDDHPITEMERKMRVQNVMARHVANLKSTNSNTRVLRSANNQSNSIKNMRAKKNNSKKKVIKTKKKKNRRRQESQPSQGILKKSRMKREVLYLSATEHSVQINNSFINDTNTTTNAMEEKMDTERVLTPDDLSILRPLVANSVYYKYSIDYNSSNASSVSSSPTVTNLDKTHNYEIDVIASDKAINDTRIKSKQDTKLSLKHIKNQRDMTKKVRKSRRIIRLSAYDSMIQKPHTVNDSISTIPSTTKKKHKFHGQDIKRTNKRYLRRMIFPSFTVGSTNYYRHLLQTKNTIGNVSNSNSLPNNIVIKLHQNQTKKRKQQTYTFKYLKNIMRMIFNHNKINNLKKDKTKEGRTLEVLCNYNEACYTNVHNKLALRAKLHDLNAEVETIFNAIKVIEMTLQHLNVNVEKQRKSKLQKNEILKLVAILRENQIKNTTLQDAQINFLKQKLNTFIQSIGKFSSILHQILDELYKNNKTYSCQRDARLIAKQKKLRSVNKIKNLLVQYNIYQNTFIKMIFKLLTNVDNNNSVKKPFNHNLDNKEDEDIYFKIIENLRRLKGLALVFKSRRKRDTMMDTDEMEYLLTLMDYILGQNRHLNSNRAYDGLDLLIEAIQNAPDIKSIKKQVLAYLPATQIPEFTSVIDQYTDIKPDSDTLLSNQVNIKSENEYTTAQNSDFNEYFYSYFKKNVNDNRTLLNDNDITEYPTKNKFVDVPPNDKSEENSQDKPEKMLERTGFDKLESMFNDTLIKEVLNSDLDSENAIAIAANITSFSDDTENDDNTNVLSTTPQEIYETFAHGSESTSDINISSSTINPAAAVEQETRRTYDFQIAEEVTTKPIASIPARDFKFDDDDGDNTNKKPKLDWIEENFESEIREYTAGKNTITLKTFTKPTTAKPDNVDSKQSIGVAEPSKESKKPKNQDEIMHLKEIQFLNYLDYGQKTDKPDFEDVETKDDDAYSAYI